MLIMWQNLSSEHKNHYPWSYEYVGNLIYVSREHSERQFEHALACACCGRSRRRNVSVHARTWTRDLKVDQNSSKNNGRWWDVGFTGMTRPQLAWGRTHLLRPKKGNSSLLGCEYHGRHCQPSRSHALCIVPQGQNWDQYYHFDAT